MDSCSQQLCCLRVQVRLASGRGVASTPNPPSLRPTPFRDPLHRTRQPLKVVQESVEGRRGSRRGEQAPALALSEPTRCLSLLLDLWRVSAFECSSVAAEPPRQPLASHFGPVGGWSSRRLPIHPFESWQRLVLSFNSEPGSAAHPAPLHPNLPHTSVTTQTRPTPVGPTLACTYFPYPLPPPLPLPPGLLYTGRFRRSLYMAQCPPGVGRRSLLVGGPCLFQAPHGPGPADSLASDCAAGT